MQLSINFNCLERSRELRIEWFMKRETDTHSKRDESHLREFQPPRVSVYAFAREIFLCGNCQFESRREPLNCDQPGMFMCVGRPFKWNSSNCAKHFLSIFATLDKARQHFSIIHDQWLRFLKWLGNCDGSHVSRREKVSPRLRNIIASNSNLIAFITGRSQRRAKTSQRAKWPPAKVKQNLWNFSDCKFVLCSVPARLTLPLSRDFSRFLTHIANQFFQLFLNVSSILSFYTALTSVSHVRRIAQKDSAWGEFSSCSRTSYSKPISLLCALSSSTAKKSI